MKKITKATRLRLARQKFVDAITAACDAYINDLGGVEAFAEDRSFPKLEKVLPKKNGKTTFDNVEEIRAVIQAAESVDAEFSPREKKILTALAQHPDGLTKAEILLHINYAASGALSTSFATILRNEWAVKVFDRLKITERGRQRLGPFEKLPVGDALRRQLLEGNKLHVREKAILGVACRVYPKYVSKGEILASAHYAASGAMSTAFARLIRYGYLKKRGTGFVQANEILFDKEGEGS